MGGIPAAGLRTTSMLVLNVCPLWLKQGFLLFTAVYTRLADAQASGDSSDSHLATGMLGLQAQATDLALGFERPSSSLLNKQPQATPFEVFTRLRASLLSYEGWVFNTVEVMADHELASAQLCLKLECQ